MPPPAPPTPAPPTPAPPGDRIAKVLSRAGVASRREAERMIELGQVAVNGKVITSPALNVTASDRITVDGKPVAAPQDARLWLYYKPLGLVTTSSDEKGRPTVFESLPPDLPCPSAGNDYHQSRRDPVVAPNRVPHVAWPASWPAGY